MLASNPEESTSPSMPVAMESTPMYNNTSAQAMDLGNTSDVSNDAQVQNLLEEILASPEFKDLCDFEVDVAAPGSAFASPETVYMSSPYVDTPYLDFSSASIDGSPASSFLTTPQIKDQPEFPTTSYNEFGFDLGDGFNNMGMGMGMGMGGGVDTYLFGSADKAADVVPTSMFDIPIDPSLLAFSVPQPTPAVAPAPAPAPTPVTAAEPVVEQAEVVATSSHASSSSKPTTKPRGRRANATGTRKNITPDNLLGLEAPTQTRKYAAPSVTSRKEVPAIFARKRLASEAFADEDLDEEMLAALPPNATEKEQIEWKRRQNTLAARKSRKRKLEHLQVLETKVEGLQAEAAKWKARSDTLLSILRSHGHPIPDFEDI